MSNKCLITKLKGVVDNPDLPIFGEKVLFHITEGTITDAERQQAFCFSNSKPCVIKAKGSGYFSTSLQGLNDNRMTLLQCAANTMIIVYVPNETFDIAVTEAYSLTYMDIRYQANGSNKSIVGVNLSELKYSESITTLNLSYTKSVGDLSDISKITGFTGATALTLIATNITGSIENFVAGQVAAGVLSRTDNTFGISALLNGKTTFKNFTGTANSNVGILNWDGATRIFLYSGSAIVKTNCNYVYETGATAAEIAAWRAEGKTVVDVDTLETYEPTNS